MRGIPSEWETDTDGQQAAGEQQRMRIDWARQIKKMLTVDFPDVEKIVLVMDNAFIHNYISVFLQLMSRIRNVLKCRTVQYLNSGKKGIFPHRK